MKTPSRGKSTLKTDYYLELWSWKSATSEKLKVKNFTLGPLHSTQIRVHCIKRVHHVGCLLEIVHMLEGSKILLIICKNLNFYLFKIPSSSKWSVSIVWVEGIEIDVEFSDGIFRIISSKIGSLILYEYPTSSSTDRAFITAFKNGVKLPLNWFSSLESSCGKKAR